PPTALPRLLRLGCVARGAQGFFIASSKESTTKECSELPRPFLREPPAGSRSLALVARPSGRQAEPGTARLQGTLLCWPLRRSSGVRQVDHRHATAPGPLLMRPPHGIPPLPLGAIPPAPRYQPWTVH